MSIPSIFPVIMAGGASSRLWPASGRDKPKWDLRLFGEKSLLESAWERARSVAPARNCFVVTGAAQARLVRKSLPKLPAENLLVEPQPRDTSGTIAFAAGAILRMPKSSNAVMLVLPGDHVIAPLERFKACAQTGAQAAGKLGALVTFGIVPRGPATGYGYIHRGERLGVMESESLGVFRVLEFKEKPGLATAQQYVASGEYYWNGGIFLWRLDTLLAEFERQLPGHAELARTLAACPKSKWNKSLARSFRDLKKISIDFGIMEHAQAPVLTVPADFDWDDIGSWSAVAKHFERRGENAVGPQTGVIAVGAASNVVFAPGKRVALAGVEGLAVVSTGTDILVCRLDKDQDVKKIAEEAQRGT